MKIYISDKEIDDNYLNYVEDDFVEAYWLSRGQSHVRGFEIGDDVGLVEIQSLEQHEEEIRKQERLKVITELEEWVDDIINILLFGKNLIDYEDIKQKLNEMKEV